VVFFLTQYKLPVAVALDDWKEFVEKELELGYICNMDEINKKSLANSELFPRPFS
jgi:hypothetical protein